ncbi:FAD-dependent monooxygenase [Mycobacterium sp. 23]|uniref:FAD-dependent monooxygenase n=1 Tax=Mycobacterium sp. 23 TaxID=3400424 RepID=UPI003AAAEBED
MADVVIAGGAPNRPMLARELGLAGIQPVLLDQSPGPNTRRRAASIVGQGARIFDHRGLYATLAENRAPAAGRRLIFCGLWIQFRRSAQSSAGYAARRTARAH